MNMIIDNFLEERAMKTRDGVEITVGMTIWVNPECVFQDEITPHAFTGKQIVDEIGTHIVWAHPEHSKAFNCDFLFAEIFAKKEKWLEDRQEKMEEIIVAKRETMMLETAKMEQELARIEKIRDDWVEL